MGCQAGLVIAREQRTFTAEPLMIGTIEAFSQACAVCLPFFGLNERNCDVTPIDSVPSNFAESIAPKEVKPDDNFVITLWTAPIHPQAGENLENLVQRINEGYVVE